MAELTAQDRTDILAEGAREFSNARAAFNLSRADFLAAIVAIDQWVEANATNFNTAIPQPARSTLTTKQKAQLLYRVTLKRFNATA